MSSNSEAYYNQSIVESMMNDLHLGLTLSDAASRHRIPVDIVMLWYSDNFNDFRELVNKATVECKRMHLGRLVSKDASMVSVKASTFMLERKFKDEFGSSSNDFYSAKELQVFMLKMAGIVRRHLGNVSPEIVAAIAKDLQDMDIGRAENLASLPPSMGRASPTPAIASQENENV